MFKSNKLVNSYISNAKFTRLFNHDKINGGLNTPAGLLAPLGESSACRVPICAVAA